MLNKFYYYMCPTFDPHYTLAVEEYVLEHIGSGEIMLYLYQHRHTVVIGKHQNPWRECRTDLLESEEGCLVRRISGGGAVYHDLGNLNFSFIVDKDEYDLERQLSVIVRAVNSVGIHAEPTGRNDITADGRKFSGNAFCHRKQGAFHHGTILVDTDMTILPRYLQVSKEKIESKGISSVQSRVVNLKELNPALTVEDMITAVKDAFEQVYGSAEPYPFPEGAEEAIAKIAERNRTREWKLGQTPHFDIELDTRFPWGGISLCLKVKDAHITGASVYSDSMHTDFIDALNDVLVGCEFNSLALAERILSVQASAEERPLLEDIAAFVRGKGF